MKKLLLFVVILAFGAGVYFVPTAPSAPPVLQTATSSPSTTTGTAFVPNVTVIVASSSYRLYAVSGTTVLESMRTLASTTDFTFTSREYPSLGMFVDSINGKKNEGGYYWFLYINGKSSELGISSKVLHAGDIAEWRYKKGE